MKASNIAAALYAHIGGTAEHQAFRILMGWDADKKAKPKNKRAGSKLSRQIKRANVGLTCRHGMPIPETKRKPKANPYFVRAAA